VGVIFYFPGEMMRALAWAVVGALVRCGGSEEVVYANATRKERKLRAPYLLVATQRTGSAWIMKSLISRRYGLGECRLAGQYELFMQEQNKTLGDWWNATVQREALAAVFDPRADVTRAVRERAPAMYDKLLAYTRGQDERWGAHPFGFGFKWMTNQGMDANWDWFLGLARARGVKVIFLKRRDYLRMAVSRYHNVKMHFEAHPTEAEAVEIRHAPVVLPNGTDLVDELDYYAAKFRHMDALRARADAAGVATMTVLYEDFVDDYEKSARRSRARPSPPRRRSPP